jgi:uncharacterized peroxidase-related enzyme
VHSLRPEAMLHHLDLYMGLLFGPGGLGRRQRELIAVVVSRANDCEYCVSHHREALARYLKDEAVLDAACTDYRQAALGAADRALADYADKLTRAPATIMPSDLDALRAQGFTDADLLLCNLVAAYFNFVNRIALGLGVSHDADEVGGYKY